MLSIAAYSSTHTHPFNGPLSGTTRVSWYQKGKTNRDFTEARDSEWQWHQLGRIQVCTALQTDSHASTPPLSSYRPDALPAAQPTASKHWRQLTVAVMMIMIAMDGSIYEAVTVTVTFQSLPSSFDECRVSARQPQLSKRLWLWVQLYAAAVHIQHCHLSLLLSLLRVAR